MPRFQLCLKTAIIIGSKSPFQLFQIKGGKRYRFSFLISYPPFKSLRNGRQSPKAQNNKPKENFAPQQRLETGAHTLALFYPFASVEAGTVTRRSARRVCAGGTVKIAPSGIKATVTGQGMASETPWDGTLECEETLLPIAIKARSIDV